MSEAEYVCTLDEETLNVAKKELTEDPLNREGAIQTLRQWIKNQKHLQFTRDTSILLAYLRYAKYSQLRARKTIENYCKHKTEAPTWFDNFDPFSDDVNTLVRNGYLVPLPGYDEKGRKRIIHREAAYNPAAWKGNKGGLAKATFTMFFALLKDQKCQINGVIMLSDMTGLTFAHQTFWSMEDMKRQINYWQNTMPGRYKGMYNYNCGPIFEALMALCKPFFSAKMQERMIMAGSNMEDLYHAFPKEVLPSEYLPDDYNGPNAGSLSQLADDFLVYLQQPDVVDFLKLVSHPDWKVDMKAKEDIPNASFRKLNVD